MSLWKVAWRSIRQRTLVSLLTVLSMGLGVALVVAVLVVYGVVEKSFHHGGEGYDLIVGAKGGKEQLVLNTVFYLSQPVGNIPYDFYEELNAGKYGRIEKAIPVCMGHTYQGFRVVGTTDRMFDKDEGLRYGSEQKAYEFAEGENFKEENHFDAVMGAIAAYRTQLGVGEKFQAVHGSGEGGRVHKETFNVVGILAPTGTPVDRAVFVNMQGFQDIHHHEEEPGAGDEHEHHAEKGHHADHADEPKEITAILVCIHKADADRGMTDVMAKRINSTKLAQAVAPVRVITDLFEAVIGKLQWILLGMAVLTVIEAGIGIMVSIYNSMSDRRHEIAVMRAPGRQPNDRHGHHPDGVDLVVVDGRRDGIAARTRHHLALFADDRRLDRRGDRPVAVPIARIDFDPRPGLLGLGRRLFAGYGGLSDRRGEVVDYHAVREWRGGGVESY